MPDNRGILVEVIRGITEAPIITAKILPQMLLPVYFSRKILTDEINLKKALQVFGTTLATSILILDNIQLDDNDKVKVITGTGYEIVQTIVALASFCFVHLILSVKSPQHETSRPFSAYLCYIGLGSLVISIFVAISINTGALSFSTPFNPAIFLILILLARCLRRVYCEVHSSLIIFFVVTFAVLFVPNLFMLLIGGLGLATFGLISGIVK